MLFLHAPYLHAKVHCFHSIIPLDYDHPVSGISQPLIPSFDLKLCWSYSGCDYVMILWMKIKLRYSDDLTSFKLRAIHVLRGRKKSNGNYTEEVFLCTSTSGRAQGSFLELIRGNYCMQPLL